MYDLIYEHYKYILDNVDEEIYIVDDDYKIVYVNKNAKINLFNNKNVIGKSLFDAFQSLTMENSSIASVFKTGIPLEKREVTFITGTGKRKEALTSTLPLLKGNNIVGVCEISKDITGLSNLSKELITSEISVNKLLKKDKEKRNKEKKEYYTKEHYTLDSIIGTSPAIMNLKEQIKTFANSPSNLLIYGETGTGKEMVAQSIYSLSKDKGKAPFVAINCAAIPENLLESILFGSVKGAYTGAETRPGLLELATGGVLFLDEINSMPIALQAKILRVLEEGKVRRVGGSNEIDLDFRLISSTNEAPEVLLSNDNFRKDLFYRINVLYIEIPPLRDRKEDIPILIDYFINEFNKKFDKNIIGFDNRAMGYFMKNDWMGNVRELKNIVERSFCFAKDNVIRYEDIYFPKYCAVSEDVIKNKSNDSDYLNINLPKDERIKLRETLEIIEIEIIKEALLKSEGNVSKAARELDIPQQTLDNKVNRYNLKGYIKNIKLL